MASCFPAGVLSFSPPEKLGLTFRAGFLAHGSEQTLHQAPLPRRHEWIGAGLPLTVAGPRRSCTGFPDLETLFACRAVLTPAGPAASRANADAAAARRRRARPRRPRRRAAG